MLQDPTFGYWLRLKRKSLDLTREQLADRVGCSAATIRKLEAEERKPSAQIVERLAEIFEIRVNERKAFQRFTRGDWKAAPGELEVKDSWKERTGPSNLPNPVTRLIGREQQLKELQSYLRNESIRFVTLTGLGGVGKTRLSIEVARAALPNFSDGVYFVSLASLEDASLVDLTIGQTLGFVEAGEHSAIDQLKFGIGRKQMLIVLDNCEHLVAHVAELISELLKGCPRLKILATSRESLRTPGEWLYPLPPLNTALENELGDLNRAEKVPALALFAERARSVKPDFAINAENIRDCAAICERLEGLPLAIELIASRVRMMSPKVLLEQLSGSFILSVDSRRPETKRHKTLRAAIDWSFTLLTPDEQRLFTACSVFSAGFDLEALASLFSQENWQALIGDLVTSLLDKSLLKYQGGGGNSRFTMHSLIQEYAFERLEKESENEEMRNRHLSHFLSLVEIADQYLRGPRQVEWTHRLDADNGNLRAALAWAIQGHQAELALRFTSHLTWFWYTSGYYGEAIQWLQLVLDLPEARSYPAANAQAWVDYADFINAHFGIESSQPFGEKALTLARTSGDRHVIARALITVGLNANTDSDYSASISALKEAAGLMRELGDQLGIAEATLAMSYACKFRGDWIRSLDSAKRALVLFNHIGDLYSIGRTLRVIASNYYKLGQINDAESAMRESLTLTDQMESKFNICNTLFQMGVGQSSINPARALILCYSARQLAVSIGGWFEKDENALEKVLASVRDELDETKLIAAIEKGKSMRWDEAINFALDPADLATNIQDRYS